MIVVVALLEPEVVGVEVIVVVVVIVVVSVVEVPVVVPELVGVVDWDVVAEDVGEAVAVVVGLVVAEVVADDVLLVVADEVAVLVIVVVILDVGLEVRVIVAVVLGVVRSHFLKVPSIRESRALFSMATLSSHALSSVLRYPPIKQATPPSTSPREYSATTEFSASAASSQLPPSEMICRTMASLTSSALHVISYLPPEQSASRDSNSDCCLAHDDSSLPM